MRRSWLLLVCSVAMLVAAGGVVSTAAAQSGTVRCESRGSARDQCAIDRGAQVRLARQLSDRPCRENSTWGAGPGYIWVSGGCRGEFAVSAIGAYPRAARATPTPRRCSSAPAGARPTGRNPGYSYDQVQVEAYQREGSTAWVRWSAGNTERHLHRGVERPDHRVHHRRLRRRRPGRRRHADHLRVAQHRPGGVPHPGRDADPAGPAAQPESLPAERHLRPGGELHLGGRGLPGGVRGGADRYPGGGGGPGGTTQVTCESASLNRQVCPIPAGTSARLVRQLSDSPCRLNSTYGFDRGTIWVANGCRGLFEVTRYGGPGGGSNVSRITCSSNGAARQQCGVQGASRVGPGAADQREPLHAQPVVRHRDQPHLGEQRLPRGVRCHGRRAGRRDGAGTAAAGRAGDLRVARQRPGRVPGADRRRGGAGPAAQRRALHPGADLGRGVRADLGAAGVPGGV